MKFLLSLTLLLALSLAVCAEEKENNDFYDNIPATELNGPSVFVFGEVENPGKADFSALELRSVIVRETGFEKGLPNFVGAYRYDGYSLFDILKERFLAKKNVKEFQPIIDLVVSVENPQGEKVVLSWGEVYYPSKLHQVIIATRVTPIIPTHSKDQWPIPQHTKLICGNDMISVRNISNPHKITIFAAPVSFKTIKGLKPMYQASIRIKDHDRQVAELSGLPAGAETRNYPACFYGRGRGFHGIQYFNGALLSDFLSPYFQSSEENLKSGYFVAAAQDGYRVALTYSEIFNRNDYADFVVQDIGQYMEDGRFRLFPAHDFFSDRAVKALNEIVYLTLP
ncbi:MAG: hypothetical protein PHQ23_00830 [Candidatus Wallbacteria bacterium]|nr:hypothetical protein [Candidatus Wallbacteria bacterium]